MASLSRAISNSLKRVIAQDQLHMLVLPAIGLGSTPSADMAAAAVAGAVMEFLYDLKPQTVNPVRSLAFPIGCK